jgi:hypothetical protein
MAPPSAIEPQNGDERKANTTAPLEPGLDEKRGKQETLSFPKPPKFDDPYKERAYLKGRLAAAFRIFGKFGFDEGVAGHITLRVRIPFLMRRMSRVGLRRLTVLRTPWTHVTSG